MLKRSHNINFGKMRILSFFKKSAFTLTELLIALAVIGILSSVLYPIILHIMPDRNVVMAKRAFYTTETIVADMINDRHCYPNLTQSKSTPRVGFDDGKSYSRCNGYRVGDDDSFKKFVNLFTSRLDLSGVVETNGTTSKFKTKDGLTWEISLPEESEGISNFQETKNKKLAHLLITVDTNGSKSPNCGQYTTIACNGKKHYDKYVMRVFATGKIQILDCWAVHASLVSKDLTNDKSGTGNEKEEGAVCADLGEDPAPVTCTVQPSVHTDPCCEEDAWKDSEGCKEPESNECDCSLHPESHEDDCCDPEKCPNTNWSESSYCSECYPYNKSTASSCCDTWYNNPTLYGNFGSKDSEEKAQTCCGISDFNNKHSSSGDVCYVEQNNSEQDKTYDTCGYPSDCTSTYSYDYCYALISDNDLYGITQEDVDNPEFDITQEEFDNYNKKLETCCYCGGFRRDLVGDAPWIWGDYGTSGCYYYNSSYNKIPDCSCNNNGKFCKAHVTFKYEVTNKKVEKTYSNNLCAGSYKLNITVIGNPCNNQDYKIKVIFPNTWCIPGGNTYCSVLQPEHNWTCSYLVNNKPSQNWYYINNDSALGCMIRNSNTFTTNISGKNEAEPYKTTIGPFYYIGQMNNGECVSLQGLAPELYDSNGDPLAVDNVYWDNVGDSSGTAKYSYCAPM